MPEASPPLLQTAIPGLPLLLRGKVRDVYDLDTHLLIVATDRISAYDVVMPNGIPGKGRVLTQLSAFWFEEIRNLCPSHFISAEPEQIYETLRERAVSAPDWLLDGRAMLVTKARPLPIECVVRGYLDGSGWRDYRATGKVCGIELPRGLSQGDRLPEPIFTPATKSTSGHDENITLDQAGRLVPPGHLKQAVALSRAVYRFAAEYAGERGILIADTKFEFGLFQEMLVMIDECLTPDSSRFWDARRWKPGAPQFSFDKQYVRDYLDSTGWNHEPPAPPLPADVVRETSAKYRDLYLRITGAELE